MALIKAREVRNIMREKGAAEGAAYILENIIEELSRCSTDVNMLGMSLTKNTEILTDVVNGFDNMNKTMDKAMDTMGMPTGNTEDELGPNTMDISRGGEG